MLDPNKMAAIPTEHAQQTALFCWAANEVSKDNMPELSSMFAIPNGGLRDKITASNMVAEGVRKGIPDIMLPVARKGYNGLFIEMKREAFRTRKDGGRSKEQINWSEKLTKNGYAVCPCYGFEHAKQTLISYLT